MSQPRAVYLPPRSLSDLVLHYRDAEFHVHKLVLNQQSEVFRDIISNMEQELASASAASSSASASTSLLSSAAGDLRDSSSSPPASKRARSPEPISPQSVPAAAAFGYDCRHSRPVACMRLPHSFGVRDASTDDLQLFLEHLYFPCLHPFPPFVPHTRVDLSTIERDDTALPLFPTPDVAAMKRYCRPPGSLSISSELLSLIHYFLAERLWQQCVAVIRVTVSAATARAAWFWLYVIFRFGCPGQQEQEDWLCQQAAKDTAVDDSDYYRKFTAAIPNPVMLRIMKAMQARRQNNEQ